MSPRLAGVVDERGQISSIARFLSSCKHGGLWDRENNMYLSTQYTDNAVVTANERASWEGLRTYGVSKC